MIRIVAGLVLLLLYCCTACKAVRYNGSLAPGERRGGREGQRALSHLRNGPVGVSTKGS